MAFTWKNSRDMFKGEGIYFLTFAVTGRRPLLGKLVPVGGGDGSATVVQSLNTDSGSDGGSGFGRGNGSDGGSAFGRAGGSDGGHQALVACTTLGMELSQGLQHISETYPWIRVLAKQIMPDHIHVVLYAKGDVERSIKQVAHGYRLWAGRKAREMGVIPGIRLNTADTAVVRPLVAHGEMHVDGTSDGTLSTTQMASSSADLSSPVMASSSADLSTAGKASSVCMRGAYHAPQLLESPFIRTLAHRGQLDRMIKYVHANPDAAWERHQHPELYTIHRNVELAGLRFDAMGKARLLDYPDRQVIALSRSLTQEQIDAEVRKALYLAESGAITYTAAINKAEKAVSTAIREAGYPLVVMMLDGFPPEGSEAACYFHPNGIYHTICGKGLLYLLAPSPENYENPRLISLTDQELARKAAMKGFGFTPLPHDTKRWRMIAGNVMLQMIGN